MHALQSRVSFALWNIHEGLQKNAFNKTQNRSCFPSSSFLIAHDSNFSNSRKDSLKVQIVCVWESIKHWDRDCVQGRQNSHNKCDIFLATQNREEDILLLFCITIHWFVFLNQAINSTSCFNLSSVSSFCYKISWHRSSSRHFASISVSNIFLFVSVFARMCNIYDPMRLITTNVSDRK